MLTAATVCVLAAAPAFSQSYDPQEIVAQAEEDATRLFANPSEHGSRRGWDFYIGQGSLHIGERPLHLPQDRLVRFAHSGSMKDLLGREPNWSHFDPELLRLQREAVRQAYGDDVDRFLDDHTAWLVEEFALKTYLHEIEEAVPAWTRLAIATPAILEAASIGGVGARGARAMNPRSVMAWTRTTKGRVPSRASQPNSRVAGLSRGVPMVARVTSAWLRFVARVPVVTPSVRNAYRFLFGPPAKTPTERIIRRAVYERGAIDLPSEGPSHAELRSLADSLQKMNPEDRLGVGNMAGLAEINLALHRATINFHPDIKVTSNAKIREVRMEIMEIMAEAHRVMVSRISGEVDPIVQSRQMAEQLVRERGRGETMNLATKVDTVLLETSGAPRAIEIIEQPETTLFRHYTTPEGLAQIKMTGRLRAGPGSYAIVSANYRHDFPGLTGIFLTTSEFTVREVGALSSLPGSKAVYLDVRLPRGVGLIQIESRIWLIPGPASPPNWFLENYLTNRSSGSWPIDPYGAWKEFQKWDREGIPNPLEIPVTIVGESP